LSRPTISRGTPAEGYDHQARSAEYECVAVGRGARDVLAADQPSAPRSILDHHGLTETFAEIFRGEAAERVVAAARRERDDEAHRFRRVSLSMGRGRIADVEREHRHAPAGRARNPVMHILFIDKKQHDMTIYYCKAITCPARRSAGIALQVLLLCVAACAGFILRGLRQQCCTA
jgi:hypothetical protein